MSAAEARRPKAAIFGCSGLDLTAAERRFYADQQPFGFILFQRNCDSPDQVKALVDDLRQAVGRPDAPVLIDQEGGRVARLKPPHWWAAPPGAAYGELYARDTAAGLEATRLGARLIAADLQRLGIDVDCLPVLDVPVPGAHDVIGDRAYSRDPDVVAALGRAAAEGMLAGGLLPVIKHIPGHGRAHVDTHVALPVVDAPLDELEATDFAPFRALADLPWGMTAHVVYSAIDTDNPATTSPAVIDRVIRGMIGFDGLLLSDDLNMEALSGDLAERARAALAAGCDIALHCSGVLVEMQAVAAAVGPLSDAAEARIARGRALLAPPRPIDAGQARAKLDRLLAAA